jgi:hypothetical protein
MNRTRHLQHVPSARGARGAAWRQACGIASAMGKRLAGNPAPI